MEETPPILMADDNEDDAFLVKRALQRGGLPNPVYICRDGEDVIRYLSAEGVYANR